jgi:hypothetical protein
MDLLEGARPVTGENPDETRYRRAFGVVLTEQGHDLMGLLADRRGRGVRCWARKCRVESMVPVHIWRLL